MKDPDADPDPDQDPDQEPRTTDGRGTKNQERTKAEGPRTKD
jgi:hypothetical protein